MSLKLAGFYFKQTAYYSDTVSSILQRIVENRIAFHVSVTLCCLVLLFSRRPDAFLNPQFYAEDGRVWYADAYNHGVLYSLITPEAGYYQTISRIVAIVSLLVPLVLAPAMFNLAAIAIKAIVVNFLVSSRISEVVPSVGYRIAIAFVYIALPHSSETHGNLTNVQWHLALLAFLVIVAPAKGTIGKVFDVVVVAISAVSGPFCLLLVPIAVIRFVMRRERWNATLLLVLAIGSLIQMSALLTSERPSRQPLGASFALGQGIIAGHWFVSAILGERWHSWLIRNSAWNVGAAIVVNTIGFGAIVWAWIGSKLELRLLLVFALLIVAAALISPASSSDVPQWTAMWMAGNGSRYWLVPIFSFFVVLLFLSSRYSPTSWVRYAAATMLAASLFGIAADWRYPRFKDLEFTKHAAAFQNAPSGQEVAIPINPDWEMRLRKK
jgi:hypothetical protein